MRLLISLALLGSCAALAGLAAVLLGLPDVAATTPHWAVTEWVLSTTMERSVERRAAAIGAPGDLDDPARIRAGASAYDEMCAGCHAAPGVEAGTLARGLLPPPPELAEEAGEWSDAEIFWITAHGVRMTGMAAFAPTHSDRELWDLVAFVRRLPGLSPSAYRSLVEAGHAHRGHAHPHDEHGQMHDGHESAHDEPAHEHAD